MSIASLMQRLHDRPAIAPQAALEDGRNVRTVAPGENAIFQAVRTREPSPMLAIRPVFAPVALFAPETARVQGAGEESAPAGLSDEAQREAIEERAAIMEFDGGLTRADAEATVRGLLADGEVSASVARACTRCQHYSRRRTCLEPVAAGLLTVAEGFGIVWPEPARAALQKRCLGFQTMR